MMDVVNVVETTVDAELRKEVMERMAPMSQVQFARLLGVNQGLVSRYLGGDPLGWKMARAISRAFPDLRDTVRQVVVP